MRTWLALFIVWLLLGCASSEREPVATQTSRLSTGTNLATWTEVPLAEAQLSRSRHAVVFDSVRNELVLFGGFSSRELAVGDTWRFNGTAWSRATPAASPSARYDHAMAFDVARGEIVLFGGFDFVGNRLDDTWRWNGTTWTEVIPAGIRPPARAEHAMTYDSARNEILLFGGSGDGTNARSDLWRWNGSAWSQATSITGAARRGASLAFDSVRNQAVLFGGVNAAGAYLGDTWRWSGTAWTQVMVTGPTARVSHAMMFDPVRARVVLFGGRNALQGTLGDTWQWNGTAWAQLSPATSPSRRHDHAVAFDTARGELVAFAGIAQGGAVADTWRWNGTTWSQASVPASPPARELTAMVFDAARGDTILFGGYSSGNTLLGDTWRWNGAAWSRVALAVSPPARDYHAMVFDSVRGEVLLFGGIGIGGGVELDDTWRWNGTSWTELTPASSPPARYGHAMTFDKVRREVLLFGGETYADYLGDTWRWNGTTWSESTTTPSPSTRGEPALAFDETRGEVVLFGGGGPDGKLADTWRWNGVAWSQAMTAIAPSPRRDHRMAFDDVRSEIILFGGYDGYNSSETWRWDGTAWSLAAFASSPPERSGHGMAFDSLRHELVVAGGVDEIGRRADTWIMLYQGRACASSAECRAGTCVDGVCCNASSCGTCETCNGLSPGECSPVLNIEDPDTCAARDNKTCSGIGVCKLALGAEAASAAQCASGIVADGVCCDQACDATCMACRADRKQSGTRSGLCDFAKRGTDVRDQCAAEGAATCGRDGTCDGRGACRLYEVSTPCGTVACSEGSTTTSARATSRICDGRGTCSSSAIGVVCGLYACREGSGCLTSCSADEDCTSRSHCDEATHVCTPDEGSRCEGNDVLDPAGTRTSCAPYVCQGGQCKSTCVSVEDCSGGASCDFSNRCVATPDAASVGEGGCAVSNARVDAPPVWTAVCASLLAIGRARRKRQRFVPRLFGWSGLLGLLACAGAASTPRKHSPEQAIAHVSTVVAADERLRALLMPSEGAFQYASEAGERALVSEGWRSTQEKRFSDLGARLPEDASGAVVVGVSRFASTQLRLTLEGAAKTAPVLHEGRVIYADVFRDTARVFASSTTCLEELLVLSSESAPRAFSYRVALPSGIAHGSPRDHGLVFTDGDGRAVLAIPQPYALDAQGARRDVALTWDEPSRTMTLAVDTRGLTFPVVVDPAIVSPGWEEIPVAEARLPRAHHAMAFDSVRNEAVVFGGRSRSGYLDDTWRWNGTKWLPAVTAVAPPKRERHAMAFDSVRGEVILFGGSGADSTLGDTWKWNGTVWSQITPMTSPSPRINHSMVFDSARGEIVLFGGNDGGAGGASSNDTWRWNGTNWSQAASVGPSVRAKQAMAFDSNRAEVLLFGGYGPTGALQDTWRWNGTSWSLAASVGPSERYDTAMAFDATRSEMILFAGDDGFTLTDTWTWNGSAWSQLSPASSPSERSAGAMVFDSARNRLFLFGGEGMNEDMGDAWTWNGSTWSAATPTSPPARTDHTMAFDAARSEVVMFGGYSTALVTTLGDTWRWNGVTWTLANPATSPIARYLHAMAYDSARGEIILFGGDDDNNVDLDDTWRWNGVTWTQIVVTPSPPAKYAHAMAFDSVRNEIIMFGGDVADTWRWNGTAWSQASPALSPSARTGAPMAFDAARGEVVLFGGLSSTSAYLNDTWRWNGTTWAPATTGLAPAIRRRASLVFDSARNELLLFGGGNPTTLLSDTWRWNGVLWSKASTSTAPPGRFKHGMAFDAARGESVMFGGTIAGISQADAWVLFFPGGACTRSSDCRGGNACVDGVCCETSSCGSCQTCAGFAPGRCTTVANAEDGDTCALRDGKSCDGAGACKAALGASVAAAEQCASGWLVDGVCCDQACTSPCMACRADLKESNSLPGRCDFAKSGSDVRDHCTQSDAATCQQDGTCDGAGGCRLYRVSSPCGPVTCTDERATSRICNGLGACSPDVVGVACGAFTCVEGKGCADACTSNADCAARSHCESSSGLCVPDVGARCDGNDVVDVDGARTTCGAYVCEGAQCKTTCTSVKDCTGEASCDFSNHCVLPMTLAPSAVDAGGCRSAAGSPRFALPWAALLAFARFMHRRRRGASSTCVG